MSRGPWVAPSPIPTDLARERGPVLHTAVRDLPLRLLEPLLQGVRRHADSLAPGSLHIGRGGCAVGMMLHELRGTRPRRRLRWRSPTIYEDAPAIARAYPRLAHIEFIFDRTCQELAERRGVEPCEVARDVGLWMAAEVEVEINLRRREVEARAGVDPAEPLYVPAEWKSERELEHRDVSQPTPA